MSADVVTSFEPLIESSLVEGLDVLHARYAQTGYLYLPGVLDRAAVSEVAQRFRAELWRQAGRHPSDGAGPLRLDAANVDTAQLHAAVDYQPFWESGPVLTLFADLFGQEVFVFQHSQLRWLSPSDGKHLVPPHQDFAYLGPQDDFRTFWMPLCDMTHEIGGLALAPGSHHEGPMEHTHDPRHRSQTNDLEFFGVPSEGRTGWAKAPTYSVGDLLTFSPFMLHRSVPNVSTDGALRLSIDVRVQPATSPRGPAALLSSHEIKQNAKTGDGWVPRSPVVTD